MPNNVKGDGRTQDSELLKELSEDEFIRLSKAQVATLVAAIKQDLDTLANKRIDDEDRLAKVEKQTRVLAEAVIAIAETPEALALAVRAVKDEM